MAKYNLLGNHLHEKLRIIVSAPSDDLATLEQSLSKMIVVNVESFDDPTRRSMVNTILAQYNKRLGTVFQTSDSDYLHVRISSEKCPGFLRQMSGFLRQMSGFPEKNARIS